MFKRKKRKKKYRKTAPCMPAQVQQGDAHITHTHTHTQMPQLVMVVKTKRSPQ